MKRLLLLSALVITANLAFAQLQIDNQLQMTGGTNASRQITNVGNPGAADHAVNAGTVQSGALSYAVASGTDNYVITLSPVPAAYVSGMVIHFVVVNANTGAATLNVNTLGPKSIKKAVSITLAGGDLAAGQAASVVYDGTNFQLLSGAGTQNGTVTSVGLSMPSLFSVSGSPVTTSGTLAVSLQNQSPNIVFAGPASGGSSTPGFRALVAADLPNGLGNTWQRSGTTVSLINVGDNVSIGLNGINPVGKLEVNVVDLDRIAFYGVANNRVGIQSLLDNQSLTSYNYGGTENQILLQPIVGYVGIGVTNAGNKLDIANATRSGSHPTGLPLYVTTNNNSNGLGVEFRHTNGSQGIGFGFNTIYATGSNADQDLGLWARGTAGDLTFYTNGSQRMIILGSGSVGIGTSTPDDMLDVEGGNLRMTGNNNRFIFSNKEVNNGWTLIYRDDFESSTDAWNFYTGALSSTAAAGTTWSRSNLIATPGLSFILTNYNASGGGTNGNVFKKSFDMSSITWTEAMVTFNYYFIDSWDGETAWVGVANTLSGTPTTMWFEKQDDDSGGMPGRSFFGSGRGDAVKSATILIKNNMTGGNFVLCVGSGLDENAADESFGFDNVEVWVR